jgi:signal transduction histidine kinase
VAAVFEVEDTGPGIREEDLDAIFLEFRQSGDRGSKRAGAGLGLAIAKRLARMHGGRVEVASQLGRGSTVRVLLPRPTSDGRGPFSLLTIPPRSER